MKTLLVSLLDDILKITKNFLISWNPYIHSWKNSSNGEFKKEISNLAVEGSEVKFCFEMYEKRKANISLKSSKRNRKNRKKFSEKWCSQVFSVTDRFCQSLISGHIFLSGCFLKFSDNIFLGHLTHSTRILYSNSPYMKSSICLK